MTSCIPGQVSRSKDEGVQGLKDRWRVSMTWWSWPTGAADGDPIGSEESLSVTKRIDLSADDVGSREGSPVEDE